MEQDDGNDGETAHAVEGRPARRRPKVLGENARRGHRRHVPLFVAFLTLAATLVLTANPAASAPAPGCGRGALVRRTLVTGGLTRSYLVRSAGPQAPVLLAFHGYSTSASILASTSGLDRAAFAAGSTVVLPDGTGSPTRWAIPGHLRGPDDVAFVDALLRELQRSGCGDTRRKIVAVGFSNGAAFTGLLACKRPQLLAGVAFVSGGNLAPACAATSLPATVPVVLVHGGADPVVPLAGGAVLGGALHAERFDRTVARWRETPGRRVVAVIVPGVKHTWPSVATNEIVTTFAM